MHSYKLSSETAATIDAMKPRVMWRLFAAIITVCVCTCCHSGKVLAPEYKGSTGSMIFAVRSPTNYLIQRSLAALSEPSNFMGKDVVVAGPVPLTAEECTSLHRLITNERAYKAVKLGCGHPHWNLRIEESRGTTKTTILISSRYLFVDIVDSRGRRIVSGYAGNCADELNRWIDDVMTRIQWSDRLDCAEYKSP